MSKGEKLTYAKSGVVYGDMDPFKLAAQAAARETAKNLHGHGLAEVEWSRGESAYLIDAGDRYIAHVEEGLGTKNLIADVMAHSAEDTTFYDAVAQDTVAMIVNDMVTLGALPTSVCMHLAVGDSVWFKDERRCRDLIAGWKAACDMAGCAWGGGETPTLRDIVIPGAAVLSGSAWGQVMPKERVFRPDKIRDGDAIVLIDSSGIHANGLTLARHIASKAGSFALLNDWGEDKTFGGALLEPTHIYVPFIARCLAAGVDIHYAVNITGHGWRKLMRAPQPLAYVLDRIPDPQPVFRFIQEHGGIDDREMYGTFNMGAGFALYLPRAEVKKLWDVFHHHAPWPFGLTLAGHIEAADAKKVVIRPKDLEFGADSLQVR